MSKEKTIQIRVTDAEKSGFASAAEMAGIPLSAWIRERLRLAAIRELENAGIKAPFVKPIGQADGN
ncbi:hypothetical protein [Parvibaculum sp.]|uniref:plasmid mobilization protein n=1 Tax=Parvibaculum sp. TaxID=2024848 RepID=UPI0034A0761C